MRTININIPISEELLFVLKKDEQSLQEEARKILAMQFFKERKLSLGKAAELAGMEKNEFVILLGKNQIDIYQYTENELEREFEVIDRFVEDFKNEGGN
ncbi:MAG: UPF0175 family protein [Clostridiales bacterium]|nr:UPF0175 family protein [Clostridiales bacterium]MCF8023600.1 UPF0175 family protein [Clostridiales bacterium]